MPIAKEISSMFEFSQNQKDTFPVDNHFDEYPLSQQRSVPTVRWPSFIPFDGLIDSILTKSSLCGYTPLALAFFRGHLDVKSQSISVFSMKWCKLVTSHILCLGLC